MHYFGAHYDAEEIIHSLMKIKKRWNFLWFLING